MRLCTGALWLSMVLLAACSVPQLRPTPGAPTLAIEAERMIVVTVRNPATPGLRGAGSTWRGWDVSVPYRVASEVQGTVRELAASYGLRAVDAWPIALLGVHCVVFEMPPQAIGQDLLRALARDARVESVQPLNRFATAARELQAPLREMQYSVQSMQITQAHRWAQGRGVRVAIIDTGVDYRHPKLSGRVARHLDLVGRADARFEDDRHGTAVAGVIAAADDGQGILGVAPQAELIALKACWPSQPGSSEAACNTFTLARALSAAIDLQADVLNLSLAGPADPLLARLVQKAIARGALVIGALPDTHDPGFPAMLEGVIAVRASAAHSAATRRSVVAPGEDIITTAPGARYTLTSGTSLSAAHVSGVAALLLEHRRGLTSAEFEQLLIDSTAGSGSLASINACHALARSLGGGPCSATPQDDAPVERLSPTP